MRVEVRGETADLNEYMLAKVHRIIDHAAGMHDVECDTALYGKTTTFESDSSLVDIVVQAANSVEDVEIVVDREDLGASEDASYLINEVQKNGGKATYVGIGASNPYGHHTSRFDIDEDALPLGVNVLSETIRQL